MLIRVLEWGARRGALVLAGSVLLGLAIPPLAHALGPLLSPSVGVMTTLVLLRVDFARVIDYVRRPLLVAAVTAWMLLATPLIFWALVHLTGLTGGFAAGVVMVASSCAATSSPAFARLMGLDAELSLVVALLTTFLLPFTAPPVALGLLHLDLALSPLGLMGRLGLYVAIPLLISLVLRRLLGPGRLHRLGPAVDGGTVLVVALFGVAVMDGVQAELLADPKGILAGLALAFLVNFGGNLLTALAFSRNGARVALASGLLAGNRNTALFLAVLPAAADPALRHFLVLAQFPLFLSPFLLRPVYARLRGRLATAG